jgi:hypothetical protein
LFEQDQCRSDLLGKNGVPKFQEIFVMPTETIVVLAFVVAAFALFMVVLAYGDAQTRNLPKR